MMMARILIKLLKKICRFDEINSFEMDGFICSFLSNCSFKRIIQIVG